MAPKKKPGVTSSATRSKRQAASKATVSGAKPSNRANRQAASTAKVTSDSSGGRGSGSGAARVTTGRGKPSSPGLIGTRNAVPKPDPATAPKPKFQTRPVTPMQRAQAEGRMNVQRAQVRRGNMAAAKAAGVAAGRRAAVGAAAKAGGLATLAASVINAGPVADGGLKGKPVRPKRPAPKPSKAEKATDSSFGASFQRARQAGARVFVWKGRRYTTKQKDGK